MSKSEKIYLAFRLTPLNRLSLPVILNQLERTGTDQLFKIIFLEDFSGVQQFIKSRVRGMLLYSFMTPQLPPVREELQWIEANRHTGIKLTAGGPHTSGDPHSTLAMGFDYAYSGAAETAFVPFLQAWLAQRLPGEPAIIRAPALQHLDASLPVTRYLRSWPPLEITRGCFWNCQFCQTSCERIRHRSMDSIKNYYRLAKNAGFHRRFNFVCPSAFEYQAGKAKNLNYEAVRDLLKYCRTNGTEFLEFGIFPSEARPNTFRKEFLALIKKYCTNKKIAIGAQSGSERLLKAMRRGHSVADIENACRLTREQGLIPMVDIIFGFPEENTDDRRQTLRLMKRLSAEYRARIQVHYFLPLSGTPLEEAMPRPLDRQTIDTLRKYQRDGICTDWWETGRRLSAKIVEIRNRLKEAEIHHLPPAIFSME